MTAPTKRMIVEEILGKGKIFFRRAFEGANELPIRAKFVRL
jgi:hypothetical protein